MSEEKQYTIGDKKFFTREMTVEQWEHMAGILKEFDIAALLDLKIAGLLSAIIEKKLLRGFLSIILIPVNGDFDEDPEKLLEVQNQVKKIGSQALEVLQDFLSKNRAWKDYLMKLLEDHLPKGATKSPLQAKLEAISGKPDLSTGSQTATSPKPKK